MLRPSRMSLPESITKSTSSMRNPTPLSAALTTSPIRSTCCRFAQASWNRVWALATTATLLLDPANTAQNLPYDRLVEAFRRRPLRERPDQLLHGFLQQDRAALGRGAAGIAED